MSTTESSKEFVYVNRKSDHSFTCAIQRIQCQHLKKNGKGKCTLPSVLGYGACHHHLASVFNLKVIKNRLHAWGPNKNVKEVVFEENDRIVEYGGEIITKNEKERRYEKQRGPYIAVTSEQIYDGACIRGIGSLAHRDAIGNAKLKRVNGKTVLVALEDIRHGKEITLLDKEAEKIRKPHVKAFDRIRRKTSRKTAGKARNRSERGKDIAILKQNRGGKDIAMLKDTAMLKAQPRKQGKESTRNKTGKSGKARQGKERKASKEKMSALIEEAETQRKRGKTSKGSKTRPKGSLSALIEEVATQRKRGKAGKGSKARPKGKMSALLEAAADIH